MKLSGSWHKGHSLTYNTPSSVSHLQKIRPPQRLNLLQHSPNENFISTLKSRYNVTILKVPKETLILTQCNTGEAKHTLTFQPGFWLRGFQP